MPAARLTPRLVLLLTLPPLAWASNAVLGRALSDSVPPILLNALRWTVVLALLLPLTQGLWARRRTWWQGWRWWLLSGVLGMAAYNALLYQALHTSSPVNVTLIAASLPVAMLIVGALFFQHRPTAGQAQGALLCMAGVLVVVSQGSWQRLAQVHWVQGDALMLAATLAWAGYSWLLTRPPATLGTDWPWTNTLALQAVFGLLFAWPLSAAEQGWTGVALHPSWALGAGVVFIALGPSLLAYRCWGLGVAQGGPALAAFFANLTPLFAALMSSALLGEAPQAHHALAFGLIAAGISLSARRPAAGKP